MMIDNAPSHESDVTAAEVYEHHREVIEEYAENRDDILGALARAIKTVAQESADE